MTAGGPPVTLTAARTVTDDDIALCAALTGDHGAHHTTVDTPPMAQGVLTLLAVPVLRHPRAHVVELSLRFSAPVHSGQRVESRVDVTAADEHDGGDVTLSVALSVTGPDGLVLTGTGRVRAGRGWASW